MKLTDELKILDNKIKANQAQYDLSREGARISAFSSKNLLDKYECLTGEDLTLIWMGFLGVRFEVGRGGKITLLPLSKTC